VLTISKGKAIQFEERIKRIEVQAQEDKLTCALTALERWTSILGAPSSQTPLCALSTTKTTLLSHTKFIQIVNEAVASTNPTQPLTGHSMRRGFVRLAFSRGIPIWQIMHHGDWKSLEVAMSYAEDALIPNPLGGLSGLDRRV
jgi:hypothetical protein